MVLASLLLALNLQAPAVAGTPAPSAGVPPSSAPEVTACGAPIGDPAQLPAADSPPVVYLLVLCFPTEGNTSIVEPETYMYYVKLRPSLPSRNEWVTYDDTVRDLATQDFQRLWGTGFLEDLRIEVDDHVFANGVIGKVVTYYMEERERIKVVQYDTEVLDRTKIDEALADRGIILRPDSFLETGVVTRVSQVLRELMAEKGYIDSTVTYTTTPATGGPKLVNLTFQAHPGPRIAIRDVEFVGNHAIADAPLEATLQANRAENLLSFVTHAGIFNEEKFGDDAQKVEEYYRDRGYIQVRVGRPELRRLDESADGSTRWVQLRIPVTEGQRFRLGDVTFEGNQALGTNVLKNLFKLGSGDWYNENAFRDAIVKAREVYGQAGYMEFTGFPDLKPRDATSGEPIVDVVVRITEGPQYFVNRITFVGNTTTHDSVIRREMQLIEGGAFNSEALKYSIRRLNQLGYFKPLEGNDKDLQVEKAADREHAVNVTVKVEEQNRNQIQFGAGVSQYEGFFGNLAYTTTNFIGRGETFTVAAQAGSRASNYQIAFTEPYVFSRPYSAGIDLYSRKNNYLTGDGSIAYSEVRSGATLTVGHPIFKFSRLFFSYGYEVIETAASQDVLNGLSAISGVGVPVFNPFLDQGRHTESRVTPTYSLNSVDNPIMPHRGNRLSISLPVTGGPLGGTTSYIKPEVDAATFLPVTRRTGFGLHAAGGMVQGFGSTKVLPYYVRYYLGGETQIRGVDIRTVGPVDKDNRAIGGNRFVLFNAEYYVDLFGAVRALVFHDAGQAYSERQSLDLRRLRTSSGVELRFMVPMLNVPFRLIYSWNLYRDTFQQPRGFRFAVGTTF